MREKKRLPPPTASEAALLQLVREFDAPAQVDDPVAVVQTAHRRDGVTSSRNATPTSNRVPTSFGDATDEARAFLDGLYAKSQAFLDRDPYATIGDASGFNTKVVGVSFEGRQDTVAALRVGETVELRRDADNAFDPSAIGVWYGALQLGFLRRQIAARIAPNIDGGERYAAEVTAVTGGGGRSSGINLYVTRVRAPLARVHGKRGTVVRDDVLRALIGDRPLREAQLAVLERLESGRNTLAVLGTGRGKSLCFQFPAAVRALERGDKTIVLYPLRALANDQYEALARRLVPLGLRVHRANGAIDAGERAALNDALDRGDWDIICATPEFLRFHLDRFRAAESRPALVVVDEAHHLHDATHRTAYARLGDAIGELGSPQVLALTATAGDAAFAKIRSALAIEAWVIDPTVRDNLHVVDARGTSDKTAYIERTCADGCKAIVYCNSRREATTTAAKLRARLGDVVAFYHAGVSSAERSDVERFFRDGVIRIVVATSAFGEGIDLPDVRHVFLYHLNFNFTEFNQQAGRAGRDGADASVHLLFGERDRNINDYIIERGAPKIETLRRLYVAMKRLTTTDMLRMSYADIASTLDFDRVDGSTVSVAVRTFADAGLVQTGDDEDGRFVRFLAVHAKVDLTQTEPFVEGEAERDAFASFAEVVLSAKPDLLEALIDRPIYPSGVPLVR